MIQPLGGATGDRVERQERSALGPRDVLERDHHRARCAMASCIGMDEQLRDVRAMLLIGRCREIELYSADDPLAVASDDDAARASGDSRNDLVSPPRATVLH